MLTTTRYRKRPVEVDAVIVTETNVREIAAWCGGQWYTAPPSVAIPTLEGTMLAVVGDAVIRGTRGEFYPCKPEPFADTFVAVEHLDRDDDGGSPFVPG